MGRIDGKIKVYNSPWGFGMINFVYIVMSLAWVIPVICGAWRSPTFYIPMACCNVTIYTLLFFMFSGYLARTHILENGIVSKVYGFKICYIPWERISCVAVFSGFSGKNALGVYIYSPYLMVSNAEILEKDCHSVTYRKRRQIPIRLTEANAEEIAELINLKLGISLDVKELLSEDICRKKADIMHIQ